ncbi:MAG TPA: hypothetical protein VHA05_01135 [Candidatus Saccharimonadales bacterium]|nr:hypothetical protein [Candidatus Saccharimonadales bacterium]
MSSYELPREAGGENIAANDPLVLKAMDKLRDGAFEDLLKGDAFQGFFDRLASIDLDEVGFENPNKVFVQVYFRDPSKVKLEEDEPAWIGCEYDIWGDSDEAILFVFRYLTIPAAQKDPIYDPALKKHFHITIGDDDIDWSKLASC